MSEGESTNNDVHKRKRQTLNDAGIPSRLARIGWPKGGRKLLLVAAGHADSRQAARAWAQWITEYRIEDCEHATLRLLARVSARKSSREFLAENSRQLSAIERQFWARSQQALAQSLEGLQLLHQAGIPVLALKALAQILRRPAALGYRTINDIDVAVSPEYVLSAFDILLEAGWFPGEPGSPDHHRRRLPGIHGLNLYAGQFGDIDLHNWLTKPPNQNRKADEQVFAASTLTAYRGIPFLLPSPEAEMTLTIASSGVLAGDSSDWILDLAEIATFNPLDPGRLVDLLEQYGIQATALSILSFVHSELGIVQLSDTVHLLRHRTLGQVPSMIRAGLLLRPAAEQNLSERFVRSLLRRQIRRQRRKILRANSQIAIQK